MNTFVQSFKVPPKQLVLDFDPTDLPVHGNQKGKAYHGYYGHDCYIEHYGKITDMGKAFKDIIDQTMILFNEGIKSFAIVYYNGSDNPFIY